MTSSCSALAPLAPLLPLNPCPLWVRYRPLLPLPPMGGFDHLLVAPPDYRPGTPMLVRDAPTTGLRQMNTSMITQQTLGWTCFCSWSCWFSWFLAPSEKGCHQTLLKLRVSCRDAQLNAQLTDATRDCVQRLPSNLSRMFEVAVTDGCVPAIAE